MNDQAIAHRVGEHLSILYPALTTSQHNDVARRLIDAFGVGEARPDDPDTSAFSSDEVVLITYADTFLSAGRPHLAALADFWDAHLAGVFSTIHVLPFFPSSSDGGFSITDYRRVAPVSGQWTDIDALATRARLMFDLVCNHGSAQSVWFRNFLAGRPPGESYYRTADPNDDLETVTRPRTHPLLLPVQTASGPQHVWATFSHDQVDFDYGNPDVLVEFCSILGQYLACGASRVRLDAIAYLWKEVGTSCIHLPQTHEVVKLMRTLMTWRDPDALMITETNVPHAENISYFGDGDEAHIVYNFTLAPLIVWSLLVERGDILTQWLDGLEPPPPGCTFLNFLASHDGIGLRPLEGIVEASDLEPMIDRATATGGGVSTYMTPSGPLPYELNASLSDLLAGQDGEFAARYVLAHALMLAIQGIPAIYVHSMLSTASDFKKAAATGHRRDINRSQFMLDEADEQIASGWRASVFESLCGLIRIRRSHDAFAPEQPQQVLDLGSGIVAVQRGHGDDAVLAIHNVTSTPVTAVLPPESGRRDLLSDIEHGDSVTLAPWQAAWLTM